MAFHWISSLLILLTVLNLAFTQPEEEPESTALPNNTEGTKAFSTTPRYDNSNVTKSREIEVPSIDDITNELLLTMPNQVKLSDDQVKFSGDQFQIEKVKELDDKIRSQIIEASAKGTLQALIINKFKELFDSYSQEIIDSWYRTHKYISDHSKTITTRTTYFYDYEEGHVRALDMVGLNHEVTDAGSFDDSRYYQVVSNRKNKFYAMYKTSDRQKVARIQLYDTLTKEEKTLDHLPQNVVSARDTLVGFGDELWYINSNTTSYQVNGTGEWKPGPSFPESCKMGFANFIECQNRIFAADVTNECGLKIFEYDRKPGSTWKEIGRMDGNRTYAGYACVRNKAFICGGITAEGKVLKTCKAFWTKNGRAVFSKKIADMPIERQYTWMADANGKMYVIGGWETAGRSKNVWPIEEYDPSLNKWNTFSMLEEFHQSINDNITSTI